MKKRMKSVWTNEERIERHESGTKERERKRQTGRQTDSDSNAQEATWSFGHWKISENHYIPQGHQTLRNKERHKAKSKEGDILHKWHF